MSSNNPTPSTPSGTDAMSSQAPADEIPARTNTPLEDLTPAVSDEEYAHQLQTQLQAEEDAAIASQLQDQEVRGGDDIPSPPPHQSRNSRQRDTTPINWSNRTPTDFDVEQNRARYERPIRPLGRAMRHYLEDSYPSVTFHWEYLTHDELDPYLSRAGLPDDVVLLIREEHAVMEEQEFLRENCGGGEHNELYERINRGFDIREDGEFWNF